MHTEWKTIPASTVVVPDKWGRPTEHHFPEKTILVAPTLAEASALLWADFGPLDATWRHGWICPFHPELRRRTITCSAGLRESNFCNSIFMGPHIIKWLPPAQQEFLSNGVKCYEWCHRLTVAFWDVSQEDLLALPDDVEQVACWYLDQILRRSGWYEWSQIDPRGRKLPSPLLRH